MSKTSKTIKKMMVLAGLSVVAASASALPIDAKIMIDRALNSPTLTVRYNGANTALVELRVNGESLGTRAVSAAKASGETNFTLNLSDLHDGDNEVEIRLFDRTGKLVGSDKTNISTDQSNTGPVFLKTPKVGQTVRGSVEIAMGFGRELKNVYVSFFVDNNFKKMTNYPPYTFSWDTIGESNGWHEVEAWAIDESSATFKTRKTKVFVNNPGGPTKRIGVDTELKTSANPKTNGVEGSEAGFRPISVSAAAKSVGASGTTHAPKIAGIAKSNGVKAIEVGSLSGMKSAPTAVSFAAGPRSLPPSTKVSYAPTAKVFSPKVAPKVTSAASVISIAAHTSGQVPTLGHVAAATNIVRIVKGSRLPNLTSFAVVLNSQYVDFDVNPRVDDGVPMTPFRHLLEKAGGTVDWENLTKTVKAKADGHDIRLQIGDKNALVNKLSVSLEVAPYIDRGRTIVPLSFLHEALNVNVEYDKETGHVLISNATPGK
ncbi:stalk domain-containing protein [Fimbriimonas ginsengisoli]|uniref:Copper amine oxidase-like protein n=1 Tax=Fimbriimonas ginsengisoli Gsoil 348 TaxID=661478 RepID=A0A068NNR5_FIMGI|nr:stalk domain-containing protein [Fimbriimonas ginsengisoli]AIE85061.1 copper amine oxidase-like protein [Fimbriimonas ginsengisoli Gsoil 348]